MIETIYLEIIILLLLSYILDKKILPQGIVIFLSIIMMLNEIAISTDLRAMIPTVVLFATVIMYAALQTLQGEQNEN